MNFFKNLNKSRRKYTLFNFYCKFLKELFDFSLFRNEFVFTNLIKNVKELFTGHKTQSLWGWLV